MNGVRIHTRTPVRSASSPTHQEPDMATTDPAVPAQPRPQLTEPTEPVRRGWLGYWTSAIVGVYLAYYATQQILLPRQANAIAAGDSALAVTITSYAGVA